jgi:hypothetical protein
MKMKNFVNKTLALVLVVSTLSSCLKDDSVVLNPEKGINVIEFSNTTDIAVAGSSIPAYVHSYEVTPEENLPVTVSYSGPATGAPEDITVNIAAADVAPITSYNTEQKTSYILMPSDKYSLAVTSVVIPKGKTKATFMVKFKPNTFDLSKNYALPLKITSASSGTISGNFSTILLAVGAKNKYDGVYTYIATHTASDRPTFLTGTEFTYPYDVQLRSSGASANNLWNAAFGDFLMPLITSTNGVSGFGSTNLLINFDAATNKIVSVSNAILAPSNGRKMNLDDTATGSNYYDPKTKNVFITYFMTQPGFTPFKVTAKLVYKKAR